MPDTEKPEAEKAEQQQSAADPADLSLNVFQ